MKELIGRLKEYRYPALILALGLILMLLPGRERRQETAAPAAEFDLAAFTRETEDLLSRVRGAGEVRVLMTLEYLDGREYLQDLRETGDARETETVLDGDRAPVVSRRQGPVFRGAVVLAEGGGSPRVALGLKEALASLTGLGMDRITVMQLSKNH